MVIESDAPYRPEYFADSQPSARDLPRPTFGRPQEIRGGNVKHVRTVAWSHDGRKVATGGEYKEILLFDAKSSVDSKPTGSLPSSSKPSPHNGHVGAIAWSPVDPNILVSGDKGSSAGGVVAIWHLSSPSSPAATFKISGDVLHIAFHPSGRHFAVVCPQKNKDEVFFFWLTDVDGREVWARREDIALGGALMDIGSEEINSLRFINSGKLVCAVSNDGSINAWVYPSQLQMSKELEEDRAAPEVEVQIPESGPSTAPSTPKPAADDDAAGGEKSRATSPTEETADQTRAGEAEDKEVVAEEGDVDMGEAGAEPATNGEAKEDSGAHGAAQAEAKVEETQSETQDQPATPAVGALKEKIGDVEMADNSTTEAAPSTPLPTSSAAPSRRPSPPASIKNENPIEKRKARQLQRLRHSICHSASLLSLAFDPQGRYLAVGGQDALLSMFDTNEWICERTFDACTAAIRQIAFSSDGEFIALGGDDTYIAIVSVYTGATIAKLPVHGMVNAISWHPSKNWLAYSYSGKTGVPLWYVAYQET
ncbi:hypothetical protein I317_07740 [Kwoniella heveanensis CBS 569]|nr:hypothetical protein I317_07740 [Kwoniella heveanensis CBS 569]